MVPTQTMDQVPKFSSSLLMEIQYQNHSKLVFLCTNNIVEYEALIIGLCTTTEWKITQLQVYGDSQLIVNQVNDDYNTKYEKLMPYKQLVEDLK